jgi:5S rRNA maturation endonuclease (ribonuclease M5)
MQDNRQKRTYDLDALEEQISALLEASDSGAAIIVEGMRDMQALRALGAKGPIIQASCRPALELAEDVARRFEVIIVLTDWDGKGDEMAGVIDRHLRSAGIRANLDIRSRLKKLVKKEIKDVESLSLYVERMRELNGLNGMGE